MRKFVSAVLSAVMAVTSIVIVAPSSADAAPRYSRADRERYVANYCRRNPRDRDCRIDRRRWNDRQYQRWYRDRHRDHHSGGEAAAAAIFGLTIGAMAGAAIAGSGSSHRERCEARYRSYDWRTDTYLATDGRRYRCRP